ncbi:MAG: hypothetical protein LAO23_23975, partial [Acidobacteriia bacterium]|nr:hypothetical protein [Terriglobia bacterium]
HGYLWRLYSYWRFEEKDGGVYVQLESIGLSRAVPAIIGWLVNPLLRSIPRGTISSLLGATRAAVANLRTKRDSDRSMAKQLLLSKGKSKQRSNSDEQFPVIQACCCLIWRVTGYSSLIL